MRVSHQHREPTAAKSMPMGLNQLATWRVSLRRCNREQQHELQQCESTIPHQPVWWMTTFRTVKMAMTMPG